MGKREDLIVFILRSRESQCDECGRELGSGDFLRKEGDKGLCLACADLDHLEFLPSGDAALTRRSSKHSRLRAVVLQWSRTRKQYERQGILAEPSAIDKAQEECLVDVKLREARRIRDASRRQELDREFVKAFAESIRKRYPNCPLGEENRIAEHACRKYSGRVGRTAAAKAFDPEPLDLSVRAHLRHAYTNYDELLGSGHERREARQSVHGDVERVLRSWQRG